MTISKRCTKCKIELPATIDYFYVSKIIKSGLRSDCKDCVRKERLQYLSNMNPEDRRAMKKAEQQRNSHIYRQATRKQVAHKRGVVHEDWTERELVQTYGTNCYICNGPIDFSAPRKGEGSDHSLWPDHVIPTSRGGANTLSNVRPCHRKCNQDKHTMTYDEYINKKDLN